MKLAELITKLQAIPGNPDVQLEQFMATPYAMGESTQVNGVYIGNIVIQDGVVIICRKQYKAPEPQQYITSVEIICSGAKLLSVASLYHNLSNIPLATTLAAARSGGFVITELYDEHAREIAERFEELGCIIKFGYGDYKGDEDE